MNCLGNVLYSYVLLNTVFLSICLLLFWLRRPRQISLRLIILPLSILLLLTAVFDNIIIFSDIVGYNEEKLLGLFIYRAPAEDFAYSIAAIALAFALWHKGNHDET
jgi:lycopene cyclase domain-containing protein